MTDDMMWSEDWFDDLIRLSLKRAAEKSRMSDEKQSVLYLKTVINYLLLHSNKSESGENLS